VCPCCIVDVEMKLTSYFSGLQIRNFDSSDWRRLFLTRALHALKCELASKIQRFLRGQAMPARSNMLCKGLALTLICSSCAPIQLVSKYDDQTDSAAAAMQKDVSAFFVKIHTALVPAETTFSSNQDFYRRQVVSIDAMKIRASAIPMNSITSKQLMLVEYNLAYLALIHKHCVTGALTDTQKIAVQSKGIDASNACQIEFGASSDIRDQGASLINPALLDEVKVQIDTNLGAIMQLEMAKKRGEK
jgi:hypothetical protein